MRTFTALKLQAWSSVLFILGSVVTLHGTKDSDLKRGNLEKGNSRIAGGITAYPGEFPWIVSIQATNFEIGVHLCGGSLLTSQWVLTAAHCLDSEMPEWLWVVTGEYDMAVEEGTEQRLTVDLFVKHPSYIYYERPYQNDVAMVHLSTPAILDSFTQTASLPTFGSITYREPCYEAGWGLTEPDKASFDVLQFASVSLLDQTACIDAYGSFPSSQVCAGNVEGGVGFCAGDNGGPLHCTQAETGSITIAGVMSWRDGCAAPNKPGVYMDFPYYSDWIISVISNGSYT